MPRSPNLQTEARSKFKSAAEDLVNLGGSADRLMRSVSPNRYNATGGFKARPFKKSIFMKEDPLPEVEKRQPTNFEGFQLSQSN